MGVSFEVDSEWLGGMDLPADTPLSLVVLPDSLPEDFDLKVPSPLC